MPAEIINLRRARKAKARGERETKAEANRRVHGMTRAEREKSADERHRLESHVAGHKREPDDGTA